MLKVIFFLLRLIKPKQQKSITSFRNPSFVLLKGITGNVFWTTDDGSNYESEGFTVLHRGTTPDEMTSKWDEHYYGQFKSKRQ